MRKLSMVPLQVAAGLLALSCNAACSNKTAQRDGGRQADSAQKITNTDTTTQSAAAPGLAENQLGNDAVTANFSYLERGPDSLVARLWLLNNARKSVRLQSFLFKGDEVGSYVADKLIALKAKGLTVSVVIDEIANIDLKAQILLTRISRAGIPIEGYSPVYLQFLDNLTIKSPQELVQDGQKRFHDKMFIVDGEDATNGMAIIGGANIGNEYFHFSGGDPAHMWQDQDIIVKGPIVANLTAAYDLNQATMKQNGSSSTSSLGDILSKLGGFVKLDALLRLRAEILTDVAALDNKVPRLVWEEAHMLFVHSRPREGEDKIFPVYIDQINKATKSIDISNSYFIPTEPLQKALIAAAKRGVVVRILTNTPETGDTPAVQIASRAVYHTLIGPETALTTNPIQIYEWGGDPVFKNGFTLHHAKIAMFDGARSIVGSFNLDPRSEFLNSETIMVVQSEALAKALIANFNNDSGAGFGTLVTPAQAAAYNQKNAFINTLQTTLGINIQNIL